MTNTGALSAYSGAKTGRSPLDKRVVKEPGSDKDVWWGPVNKPMTPEVSLYRLFSIFIKPKLAQVWVHLTVQPCVTFVLDAHVMLSPKLHQVSLLSDLPRYLISISPQSVMPNIWLRRKGTKPHQKSTTPTST